MDPVKVLYYEGNPDGTVGGSYFSLLYLVEAVDRSRYHPVVTFRREIPFVQRFRDAGVDVRVLSGHRPIGAGWINAPALRALGPLRRGLKAFVSALNLAKFFLVTVPACALFLTRHRIQLVHANNSVTRGHELMLGAMLARVPVVTHERGINSSFSGLTRFCAPRLAAVLCISEAVRANLRDNGVTSENLVIVHNAVDPARVRPRRTAEDVRAELGIASDQPVVAMVGNLRRWKGQHVVVEAMATVAARVPNVVCLLVGDATEADRPYEQELRARVEQLKLTSVVRFTGYRDNVADFVNLADVAIHASILPEPFGRVLLEAMALKKPIVGASGGAVPEIVVHGETGLVVPEGNADALANAVVQLLDDRGAAREMGSRGYERLITQFGIRENVARTERVYASILGSGPKPAVAKLEA